MNTAIRVLHVDDEPDIAELVASFLTRGETQFEFETASDVSDALDCLDENEFDCIVSDYDMPGQDGIEFLEVIRDEYSELPFILYTGKGSEEVASEAISAGVTDYLQKESGSSHYEVLSNRIWNAVEGHRRQAEAERTQERLQTIAQHSNDILWQFDANWDELLFINSAYEEVWGRSMEELKEDPESLLKGIHPDDRDEAKNAMAEVMDGEPVDLEYRVNVDEDFGRWVWGQGYPVFDESGEVEKVVGFARDITERKERERDLRLFREAVENSGHSIYFTDVDGAIEYANPAFEEITGYSAEDVSGLNPAILNSGEHDQDFYEELWETILAGDVWRNRLVNSTKSDERYVVDQTIAPIEGASGEIEHFVAVNADITDREKQEQEHRQVNEFVEESLDALNDVFFVLNEDMELLRWNDRLSEVSGYTEDELHDMGPTEFFPEEQHERILATIIEIQETGSSKLQTDFLTKNGETIPYEFRGTRLADSASGGMAIAGIGRDITDQIEREAQLEQFASVVSHDLRNPLGVAKGHLELLSEDCESEHLIKVEDAHERMEALIDDILTMARAENDVAERRPVALASVMDNCWSNVRTANATYAADFDRRVQADESQLRQVFENLFRNAIEHGGEKVTVTAGELENGFYIEDDGSGIPADERVEVFHVGYSTTESGTGFGLNIVKRVVEAHGWTIDVTESADGGARFEITDVEFAE